MDRYLWWGLLLGSLCISSAATGLPHQPMIVYEELDIADDGYPYEDLDSTTTTAAASSSMIMGYDQLYSGGDDTVDPVLPASAAVVDVTAEVIAAPLLPTKTCSNSYDCAATLAVESTLVPLNNGAPDVYMLERNGLLVEKVREMLIVYFRQLRASGGAPANKGAPWAINIILPRGWADGMWAPERFE